jgi:multiple sugar transport system ATP-binding protein
MTRPRLELVSLFKEYKDGAVAAVDGVDLSVQAGETIALLGPSGCGKSTTLNMIVGLEHPTSGDILIDGKSILGAPPGQRNVGLVFQDYAVFPTMTVRQNLAFGLVVRRRPKPEIDRAVEEVAALLGMSDCLEAKADSLGGSELQRVAIGRTLVVKPAILLLDEPLSNLDTPARTAMRRELRRLQSEIGLTIIYVTHDQVEALSLANRVAIMRAGKILQVDETALICERPEHVFVAGFLGSPPMNLVRGALETRDGQLHFLRDTLDLPLGRAEVPGRTLPPGRHILGLRPERIRITAPGEAPLSGPVLLKEPRGGETVLTVKVGHTPLKIVAGVTGLPDEGQTVGLCVDPGALLFFHGDTNHRLDIPLDTEAA